MAQPCCAHVQECWVRSKPAALAHSGSESAWQHRAPMQIVSQTMLMVDTVSMVLACIAAFTHNIYPAGCKTHRSLLPNTWDGVEAVWKWVRMCVYSACGSTEHTPQHLLKTSQPSLAQDNRANVTKQKTIPSRFTWYL